MPTVHLTNAAIARRLRRRLPERQRRAEITRLGQRVAALEYTGVKKRTSHCKSGASVCHQCRGVSICKDCDQCLNCDGVGDTDCPNWRTD